MSSMTSSNMADAAFNEVYMHLVLHLTRVSHLQSSGLCSVCPYPTHPFPALCECPGGTAIWCLPAVGPLLPSFSDHLMYIFLKSLPFERLSYPCMVRLGNGLCFPSKKDGQLRRFLAISERLWLKLTSGPWIWVKFAKWCNKVWALGHLSVLCFGEWMVVSTHQLL